MPRTKQTARKATTPAPNKRKFNNHGRRIDEKPISNNDCRISDLSNDYSDNDENKEKRARKKQLSSTARKLTTPAAKPITTTTKDDCVSKKDCVKSDLSNGIAAVSSKQLSNECKTVKNKRQKCTARKATTVQYDNEKSSTENESDDNEDDDDDDDDENEVTSAKVAKTDTEVLIECKNVKIRVVSTARKATTPARNVKKSNVDELSSENESDVICL
jgi:hypothetical protein